MSSINSWLEQQLTVSGSSPAGFALLFLAGVFASLLPCVYPLYPLTAAIIRQRSGTSNRLAHPLAYYAGLLCVYASFGAIAAASGGAFNSVLRWGATNFVIAGIFTILALTSLGLLDLPLFHGRDVSLRPGLAGTAIMGGAAGLLSSACVGPVVVSILLKLATDNSEGIAVGRVLLGISQMLVFGMGVGALFLCVSLFGVALPKSGRWMVAVQYALGTAILYFAYMYLEKGCAVCELPAATAPTLAVACAAFVGMAYLLQDPATLVHTRVQRALCGLGAVFAAAVIVQTLQPRTAGISLEGATASAGQSVERDGNLTWHLDEQVAYEAARRQGKNVFIDFYGSWCTNCKEFQKLGQSNAELNAALQRAVLFKVYDRNPLFKKYAADSRFAELKVGLPFFAITDAAGNLLYKTSDYLKTDEMILFVAD